MPSACRTLTAFKPSTVIGIFTTIFGWMAAISRPSLIMPSASVVVAFTSPLIGPSTIEAISAITWLKSRPSFAIRDGLVVTPQIIPISFALRISSTFAVSTKNFIILFSFFFKMLSGQSFLEFQFLPGILPQHVLKFQCRALSKAMKASDRCKAYSYLHCGSAPSSVP